MAVKNISITEEAYNALQREKRGSESFTDAILRLAKRSGKLSDSFGAWAMTDAEARKMRNDLSKGWKQTTDRLKNEVH